MATDQQFCLRWNNHQSTLVSIFDTLLENGSLVDCTLAAEGQYIKAHRVVLSACSPYFEVLMNQHYEKHPIIILKDVKYQELKSMVDYMYRGEVNISQDQLSTFLKAAESLQIKGLSDGGGGETDSGGSTTPKRADPPPKKIQSVPVPQPRSEPRKSAAASSPVPSREDSISPSLQKRRRIRRPSQGEDSNDLDSASNTSDILSQGQSAPTNVPSIPPVVPITSTPVITKQPPVESEDYEQSRLDTSSSSAVVPESGLMRAKIEPSSEGLIEPKTEYMDYLQNENSVEDLTLDDDDDMDMSRPGTSQGSNQGFLSWQLANQSGSEEFMGSQDDGVSQGRRDSQGVSSSDQTSAHPVWPPEVKMLIKSENTFSSSSMYQSFPNPRKIQKSFQEALLTLHSLGLSTKKLPAPGEPTWPCIGCGKIYRSKTSLTLHRRVECGKEPTLKCQYCLRMFHHNSSLIRHIRVIHRDILAMMARNQTI